MEAKNRGERGAGGGFELPLRAQILCFDEASGAQLVLELVASSDFVRELAEEGYRVRMREPAGVLAGGPTGAG